LDGFEMKDMGDHLRVVVVVDIVCLRNVMAKGLVVTGGKTAGNLFAQQLGTVFGGSEPFLDPFVHEFGLLYSFGSFHLAFYTIPGIATYKVKFTNDSMVGVPHDHKDVLIFLVGVGTPCGKC
jgi:hypothetical protein